MWVGQTYYFTWLDGQFGKLEKEAAAAKTPPAVWMVHSGGFYPVEKQGSLGGLPQVVHLFRWEALMTVVSGMVLLLLAYYFTPRPHYPPPATPPHLPPTSIRLP